MEKFPLEEWFDLSKPISKDNAELTEAQMALYAFKDGDDPESPAAKAKYRELRRAVADHNQKFRP